MSDESPEVTPDTEADADGEIERPGDTPLPQETGKAGKGRRGPTTTTFTLRDLLVVTYALPVERVRPHLPDTLPLDMLPNAEGERLAFVQTLCALHTGARWAVLPEGAGGQAFHQITHRVLTRREGRRGAFLLRASYSSDELRAAQRVLSRDAEFARFALYIAGNPATSTYTRMDVRAVGDQGTTQLEAHFGEEEQAPAPPVPFATWEEAASFLVDRPDNYFRASVPRTGVGLVPWKYDALPAPVPGRVAAAKVALWTAPPLSLLTAEELLQPFATLVLPTVAVTASPPRYARFK